MMINQQQVDFILASRSPRRKELLERAGYKFKIIPSSVDESDFDGEKNAAELSKKLALAKAKDIAAEFPEHLILAADTVVDFNGEIIGKPHDSKDAERIVRRLFSRPHKVITAVAVVRKSDNTEIVEADTTVVNPRKMSERQISRHIQSGAWQGKAGAYAIQQGSDKFIEKIEGSRSNVMGLPMELVTKMLERFV